ncbi:MAG: DNA-binding protein WhiA [Lachnospiraceae bacterium]|nr:DNA-binding protein WhiA [Lachnospiraceae bacterium]
MSFSSQVKEELAAQIPLARHCQLAELAAILLTNGHFSVGTAGNQLTIRAESSAMQKKCFTILQKAFNIVEGNGLGRDESSIRITDEELIRRILSAIKQWDEKSGYQERHQADVRLLAESCCRRAFIRGCFLCAGSISTPDKFYHYEIDCSQEELAVQIKEMLRQFSLDAKIILRKKYYVVYLKEGDQISDALSIMEAPKAVMEFENVRILKDVRNRVNRSVNCETANINKTAAAAAEQLEAIEYLRDHVGLEFLPKGLEDAARARLERPEASLAELGESLEPPVGKSGINHRLRKLKALADQYRENKEDN